MKIYFLYLNWHRLLCEDYYDKRVKLTALPSYFYRPCVLTPFLSRRNFSYYLHEFIPPS